jgi:hypothetical protein
MDAMPSWHASHTVTSRPATRTWCALHALQTAALQQGHSRRVRVRRPKLAPHRAHRSNSSAATTLLLLLPTHGSHDRTALCGDGTALPLLLLGAYDGSSDISNSFTRSSNRAPRPLLNSRALRASLLNRPNSSLLSRDSDIQPASDSAAAQLCAHCPTRDTARMSTYPSLAGTMGYKPEQKFRGRWAPQVATPNPPKFFKTPPPAKPAKKVAEPEAPPPLPPRLLSAPDRPCKFNIRDRCNDYR